jgi:hypothetical protein
VKKRFGFLSLFAVTVLLLGVVGAVAALAAPSAADVTGTVEFDQSWYTDDGTVKVTIKDADANVSTDRREDDVVVNTLVAGAYLGNTVLGNKPITGTPIAVIANSTTEITDLEVQVISAAMGVVNILAGATANYGTIDVLYKTSTVETVDVKLVSTQDSTGITISATETGTDTGEFEVSVLLANTSSAATTPKKLSVLDLNTITASYVDSTPGSGTSDVTVKAESQVEVGDPTFASISPVDKFSTQGTQPILTGTINDVGGAGLDVSTILILIDLNSNGSFDGGVEAIAPTVTGSDGDTTATFTLTPSVLSEGNHIWQITVTDMAGNAATSDSDDDTNGNQTHLLSVDLSPPTMSSAQTGKYWDADAEAEKSDKFDRLVIIFGENVDGDTVSASDFTVEDVSPIAAEVVSDAPTKVYLTLGSNLAADDEPVVAIASSGSVSDNAGNSLNVGQLDADDKIAPTFTITLDKDLTDDDVVITVSSNEKISGVPSVTVHNDDGSNSKTLSVVVKTTTSWEATAEDAGAYETKNSIVVAGSDLENNAGTAGDATLVGGVFTGSSAVIYTQDTTVPVVTFDPANAGTVFSTGPFITMTFDDNVVVDAATFGPKDGDLVDVLADGSLASDAETWIYKASGLTVDGEYTIKLTVTDLAGNETKDATASFTVDEKAKEKVLLVPGSNLISLSGEPADSAINVVITLAEISSVVTYDSATATWQSATRDSSGNLSGTLSTMDAQHAYWVNTTSFESIEVEILVTGQAAAPPAIAVVEGWNMVPVINVSGSGADVNGGKAGIQLGADAYFGSTKWITAYTWDTKAELWVKKLPSTFAQLTVGKGYWLYVSEDGFLIP